MDCDNLASKITDCINQLNENYFFFEMKKAAQVEAEKMSTLTSTMKEDVIKGLNKNGWNISLQNQVFKTLLSRQGKDISEPLLYMKKAQTNWERRIVKSINSMCSELGIPLSKKRLPDEEKTFLSNWSQLGVDEPDLSKFRPVYAPKDFLEVICGVRNPNYDCSVDDDLSDDTWGLIRVPLNVPSLSDLQEKFSEMNLKSEQMGLDDYMVTGSNSTSFKNDRIKFAKKIVDENRSVLAYSFCRKGCPTTSRADIWQLALGVNINHLDNLKYTQLKTEVARYDLLVDSLIYKDVKLTTVNDDYYFVFEDFLYQILLVFSRDTSVLRTLKNKTAPKSFIRGQLNKEDSSLTYPPNGFIPFHGFSMFAAPFCYLYRDSSRLYFIFREFYVRHLHHLHQISSHSEGIVSLSLLFESLLQQLHPRLFRHLVDIGLQPLKIAFKWMMRAFAGYLATDQLFQLWDRIIGYGSLQLLPVLAVAILLFRQSNLLSINTSNAIEASLCDLTPIRVIPLLQMIIFPS